MTRDEASVRMVDEIEALKRTLVVPSTGNAEQDDAKLDQAATTAAMLAADFCPNGCGDNHWESIQTPAQGQIGRVCERCGFNHFSV